MSRVIKSAGGVAPEVFALILSAVIVWFSGKASHVHYLKEHQTLGLFFGFLCVSFAIVGVLLIAKLFHRMWRFTLGGL